MRKKHFRRTRHRSKRLRYTATSLNRVYRNGLGYYTLFDAPKSNHFQKPNGIPTKPTRKVLAARISKQDKHFKKDHKE